MKRIQYFMMVILCVFTVSIQAKEWKTDNGKITLDIPSGEKWMEEERPNASFLLLQISADESSKICIITIPNPQQRKLILKSLAKGAAKEVKGKVISYDTKKVNNIEVFETLVETNIFSETQVTLVRQLIFSLDKVIYKIMAIYPKQKSDFKSDIDTFMKSLKISN